MKRSATVMLSVLLAAFFVMTGIASATNVGDSMLFEKEIGVKKFIECYEMSAAPDSPIADRGRIYCLDSGGTTTLYFKDHDGTITNLLSTSGVTLDGAYDYGGAGVGRTINATDGAVVMQSTDADTTNILEINKSPSAGAAGSGLSLTMGANSTGAAIALANSGSGNDITGSGSTWSVTKAGVATFSSLTGLTAGQTISGGTINLNASSNYATNVNTGTSTGAVTVGSGVNTVAIDTSSWDITTSGAMSGFSTFSLSGDITMANGKAVKSSTTTAETVKIQAYDVDNTTYRDAITLTNGNTVAIAIGSNNETVAIDSADWNIGATGDMTGIGAITMDGTLTTTGAVVVNNASVTLYNNEAISFGHATNGAADDLTISLTGATDSSIILSSAGTGEDAIALQSSAGGVDVDAAAAKDVNIAGGQVTIASKDDAASAVSITANVGTSETIVVTNTQGTSESAVTVTATAGGVNVDAAATKDLDLAGGQVKLSSKDDAAGAISLTANVGTSETITVTNTQGTAAGAVALTATAGGVDIDAAATKDVDIAGGQVLISSKDDAASAIGLTTNQGTSETIVVTNTQGTDAGAITLTATAGGITNTVASGKAITQNGTVNYKVGSDIASPAGGELTLGDGNYFYITGTNNITSIAAASSTSGRFVVLRFADALTFTDGNNLKLAGNLVTTADDTITLICDGSSNWYEISRSAN